MKRSHLGSLIASGAIAVGTMMTLTAPSATAMPRESISRGCAQMGGSFSVDYDGGFFSGYSCRVTNPASTGYVYLYNTEGEFGGKCVLTRGRLGKCTTP